MADEDIEITVGSDNVFRDLGFPEDEAAKLLAEAEAETSSVAEPVLYLEPEIEQDEGSDVTVRVFAADKKSVISMVILDTSVLILRSNLETGQSTKERLTHSAFVRLERKGWLEPTTLFSLQDLDRHNDLKLLDHEATQLDASVVTGLLTMARAAYHEATVLDRALKTLQSIADTGNEVAQKFLDRNKEALDGR